MGQFAFMKYLPSSSEKSNSEKKFEKTCSQAFEGLRDRFSQYSVMSVDLDDQDEKILQYHANVNKQINVPTSEEKITRLISNINVSNPRHTSNRCNCNATSSSNNRSSSSDNRCHDHCFTIKDTRVITNSIPREDSISIGDDEVNSYSNSTSGDESDDTSSDTSKSLEALTEKKSCTSGIRKSDNEMAMFARNQRLHDLMTYKCNNKCRFGKSCVSNTTFEEVDSLRSKLWNKNDELAPTSSERAERLECLLTQCYSVPDKKYKFIIENSERKRREICEQAWIRLLGLVSHRQDAKEPSQYTRIRNLVPLTPDERKFKAAIKQKKASSRAQNKTMHAITWIKHMSDIFAECGYEEKKEGVRFLPFDSFQELYDEYKNYHRYDNYGIYRERDKVTAGRECFRLAWIDLKKIRLRTAKGAFDTCSVCNNLNDCLKNTSADWTREQLEIILRLKRLHLLQQAQERMDSANRKEQAKMSVDKDGHPDKCYFEIDGYTEYKTKTPIVGQRKSKGDTKRLSSRVIAAVVTCGNIDTRFIYTLNDLISGGANIMIEIVRQAIYDLGKILANQHLKVPGIMFLQFDNCGENKNKYMFAYLSLLIELEHLDTIYVNFLVVGHTHTTVDQYFSVLTRKICSKKFVGSPIALRELFKECRNPMVIRPIEIYYDYKSYLKPIINSNLKNYQLPHCFRISSVAKRAICVHKPFSTSPKWLPHKPSLSIPDEEFTNVESNDFKIEDYDLFGGFETMFQGTVIDDSEDQQGVELTAVDLVRNDLKKQEAAKRLVQFRKMTEMLHELSVKTLCESVSQMTLEAEEGYRSNFDHRFILIDEEGFQRPEENITAIDPDIQLEPSELMAPPVSATRIQIDHEFRVEIQKEMQKTSSKTEGYIFWLDWTKVDATWHQTKPAMFNYFTEVLPLLRQLKLCYNSYC
jgi:hypothetical protein